MNLRPLIITLLCLVAASSYAQQLYGPTAVMTNCQTSFTYNNGAVVFPTWVISANGTVVSTNQVGNIYTANVKWTSGTSGTLTFKDGSTTLATANITVTTTPLAPTPTNGARCGTGTVGLSATVGAAGGTIKWYTASTGGTTFQTGATYTTPSISATTNYYITTLDACTSTESSPRTMITANVYTTPAAPTTATNGTAFLNGAPTISVVTVSGATSYKWYTVSSGGTAISGATTNSYAPVVTANATYYASAVAGGICESASRKSVTATLETNPVATIGNDVVVMGGNVTLDGGAGYATYTWKNSASATVGSTRTLSTNLVDTYTVTVTKTGVAGTSGASNNVILKSQFTSVSNQNYIMTNTLLTPITSESSIALQTVDNRSQTIQYFDGLGRPLQSVSTQASPAKKDIIQSFVYDSYGRETTKYLPYTSTTEGNGLIKSNPLGATPANYTTSPQYNFYNAAGDNIADDTNPFSVAILEDSPLGRALKQGAPGNAWQPNTSAYDNPTDHGIKLAYEHNLANEVLNWTWTISGTYAFGLVNSSTGSTPIYYNASELTKDKSKDEQNTEIIQFKDKNGRMILRKVAAGGGLYAETYYIYDDLGNLVTVIQPEGTKYLATSYFGLSDAQKDTYLNKWAFRYSYDQRNRMIMKQVPGADPVYMIYDNRDRVVLTQDGNQRILASKEWNFFKYDIMNRPVLTGKYLSNNDRATMQTAVDNFYGSTAWYETYIGSGTILGYDNKSFPNTIAGTDCYSATYYDAYDTFIAPTLPTSYAYVNESLPGQETVNATNIRGLVTATQVKILGTSTWLRTVNYYDAKHRPIQTVGEQQKGIVRSSMVLDFVGKVLITKRTYVVTGATPAAPNIKETFTYDHAGRLLTTKHSVNGAVDVMTSKNVYNEIGQLVDKNLHSTDFTNFKQSVDYRYNIRGWLTKMNESDVTGIAAGETLPDYFGMELAYNSLLSSVASTTQYNGNISAVKWSTGLGTGTKQQAYSYGYDPLNRLLNSNHYKYALSLWTADNSNQETGFSYDMNGNIQGLTRKGKLSFAMDNLAYGYTGNQLNYVHDTADPTTGFINQNTGTDDYSYDTNGNLTLDKNKGVTAITYNHLNLPVQVNKGASDYVVYTYDASGRKLSQQVFGSTPKVTDYIGEYVYEGTTPVLKIINHAEGRVLPDGANWEYQYHLKDHLGNVRVTFTAKAPVALNYTANFESATNTDFISTSYSRSGFDLVDHTDAASNVYTYVQTLTGGVNNRVGLAKSIAVMPGDQVTISAWAKYMNLTTTPNTNTLIASLSSIFGVSSSSTGDQLKLYNGLNSYAGTVPSGDHVNDDEGAPKAFVTILFFDKDYNFLDAAWKQITTVGAQTSPTVKQPPHDFMTKTASATEQGYAYVFVSNEHFNNVTLYFDDVTVTHTPSPIVSTSDYMAFGLQFGNSERVNSVEQKYLYNGKELQDELSLNWLDYGARMYDPTIGRFGQTDPHTENYLSTSPYVFALNNPVLLKDDNGKDIIITNLSLSQQKQLAQFATTTQGRAFLTQFAEKGKVYNIGGEKFTFDVKQSSNHNIQYETRDLSGYAGLTEVYIFKPSQKGGKGEWVAVEDLGGDPAGARRIAINRAGKSYGFRVSIDDNRVGDDALYTLGHEAFVHVDTKKNDLDNAFINYENGNSQKEANESPVRGNNKENILVSAITSAAEGITDHKLLVDGKIVKLAAFVKELDKLFKTTKFSQQLENDKKYAKEHPNQ